MATFLTDIPEPKLVDKSDASEKVAAVSDPGSNPNSEFWEKAALLAKKNLVKDNQEGDKEDSAETTVEEAQQDELSNSEEISDQQFNLFTNQKQNKIVVDAGDFSNVESETIISKIYPNSSQDNADNAQAVPRTSKWTMWNAALSDETTASADEKTPQILKKIKNTNNQSGELSFEFQGKQFIIHFKKMPDEIPKLTIV